MSQKFVMLFLVSNPRVVSLDVAAKILIGEDHGAEQDKNKFKSESRIATSSLFHTIQVERSMFPTTSLHDHFLVQPKCAGCTI